MRHTNISRTNVNPTRMFRIGLTPTIGPLFLRDRQSHMNKFMYKANLGLKNGPVWTSFLTRKSSKKNSKTKTSQHAYPSTSVTYYSQTSFSLVSISRRSRISIPFTVNKNKKKLTKNDKKMITFFLKKTLKNLKIRLQRNSKSEISTSLLVFFLFFGIWYNKRSIYRNFLTYKCPKTPKTPKWHFCHFRELFESNLHEATYFQKWK